jgi:hypothetical protein
VTDQPGRSFRSSETATGSSIPVAIGRAAAGGTDRVTGPYEELYDVAPDDAGGDAPEDPGGDAPEYPGGGGFVVVTAKEPVAGTVTASDIEPAGLPSTVAASVAAEATYAVLAGVNAADSAAEAPAVKAALVIATPPGARFTGLPMSVPLASNCTHPAGCVPSAAVSDATNVTTPGVRPGFGSAASLVTVPVCWRDWDESAAAGAAGSVTAATPTNPPTATTQRSRPLSRRFGLPSRGRRGTT